ncbi:Phasin protein [Methyloligella halotolerans]|uniref:Phasin protein n=1 Tax=Methyloligella halotolerans TaxID=1177755 RepID=A0A1E2RY69_9HYPH|nr:phasin family protein [Methyloligella halotolerans]ODA67164.1 Phasin protein [Methyloligella halotolerans]
MLSLMIRSFVWAAWWPASTWLLAMEKATARASDAFAERAPDADSPKRPAAYTAADFTGEARPTASTTAKSEETSDSDPSIGVGTENEARKDDMANDTFNKMEMPGSVRDLMKMGIEQARYAFENFATTSEQAMRTFEANAGPMGDSMRSLNDKISQITRANAEANFALAMKLAEANDFQQALSIQTEHVKHQMDNFGKQIEEIREMASKAIQEAQKNAASGFNQNKGFGSGGSGPVGGPGTFMPGGGN